ncbi:MAG TPA: ABC transporter ATP-binding protein, partial [Ruminococcus sp.]|nr:ABC transporter ATP-binding protein [Ruminococcus sp.]
MKNDPIKRLYSVPGGKKLYILALVIIQALHGASGVLYALLLRNIVDSAAARDRDGFFRYTLLTVILILVQIGLRAMVRWLNELSRATFENLFKARLMDNILRKD